MENKDQIVFAIFGDGKFISWTYGMFMQLVSKPKIYTYSEEQVNIVKSNFNYIIRKVNEESDFNVDLIDEVQNKDKKNLRQYKEFELKVYDYPKSENLDEIDLNSPREVYKYSE